MLIHKGFACQFRPKFRSCYPLGGGPRVVVSTAAFHARVRGSVPGLGGLKKNKNISSSSTCESIVGSLRDQEVACSASDRARVRISNPVSSHHPQEVFLAQFSLYVRKGGLKPDSFHFVIPLAIILRFQAFQRYMKTNVVFSAQSVCKFIL